MPKKLTKQEFNPETDIFTIPNAMSVMGAILAWHGAKKVDTPGGLAQVAAGRALDVADGFVARKTGQTSNFGAIVDATLDKVVTAKIVCEMWKKGATPKQLLAWIAISNTTNIAATAKTAVEVADETVRPKKAGKLALALETFSLVAYAAGGAMENSGNARGAKIARGVGMAAFAAAVPLSIKSTADYVKRALTDTHDNENPQN